MFSCSDSRSLFSFLVAVDALASVSTTKILAWLAVLSAHKYLFALQDVPSNASTGKPRPSTFPARSVEASNLSSASHTYSTPVRTHFEERRSRVDLLKVPWQHRNGNFKRCGSRVSPLIPPLILL